MAAKAMVKFPRQLKELRIHLCQKSASSQGARDFIENSYVELKKANPQFPILVRECSGVSPRVFARYEFGREVQVSLRGQSREEVQAQILKLATNV